MARIARFVVPGLPHHVTERGNRRGTVFFSDEDYELYRDLLAEQARSDRRRSSIALRISPAAIRVLGSADRKREKRD
jgi:hypothetical protein